MDRRTLLTALALLGPGLPPSAWAARRELPGLGLQFELPDRWIPVPRAEILEAVARGREAGATSDWTVVGAWQRLPHLRWFSLPHLLLESQPSAGLPDHRPQEIAHEAARAGAGVVHSHRAPWAWGGQPLRFTLLAFEDMQAEFTSWMASIR